MTPSLLRALARPVARLVRPGGVLVIGLALVLTACGSASSPGSGGPGGSPGSGGSGSLGGSGGGNGIPQAEPPAAIALAAYSGHAFVSTKVTVDGKPHALVDTTTIMLTFKGTDLGIQAGCNSMFATVRPGDDGLVVQGPIGGTEMGCDAPRMDQDSWLAKLLEGATITRQGATVLVSKGTTVITLVDKSSVTPTVALVGTTGLFDTQINGDTAASMPLGADQLWLRLVGAPSTYTAFDGCRTGSGTVSLSGSTLTFGAGLWSAQPCQAPTSSGPMVNQIALGSFLEGKVSIQLEGSRLTLTKGTSSFGLHAKE